MHAVGRFYFVIVNSFKNILIDIEPNVIVVGVSMKKRIVCENDVFLVVSNFIYNVFRYSTFFAKSIYALACSCASLRNGKQV